MPKHTYGDEIFPDPAEAFAWLDQFEGRKAELAAELLRIAYTTTEEDDHNAHNTEPE